MNSTRLRQALFQRDPHHGTGNQIMVGKGEGGRIEWSLNYDPSNAPPTLVRLHIKLFHTESMNEEWTETD